METKTEAALDRLALRIYGDSTKPWRMRVGDVFWRIGTRLRKLRDQ